MPQMYHFYNLFLLGKNLLLTVKSCFCHENPRFNFTFKYWTKQHKRLKYSTFFSFIWSFIICSRDGCPVHFLFHSIARTNINQSINHAPLLSSTNSSPHLKCKLRFLLIQNYEKNCSFLTKLFTVNVEQNGWQTASVSTLFCNLHNYCLRMDKPFFNIPPHIQTATRYFCRPSHYQFHFDLYQSGPFRQPKTFWQSMKQAHNSSSVPTIRCDITSSILLLFNIRIHFLHVYPQVPSSKYPRYYLCSMGDETECAMLDTFCSFWWRKRNQKDATNLMFVMKHVSQHVSGIIMPIIRRTRVCSDSYGVLHWLCGAGTRVVCSVKVTVCSFCLLL